jgi:hypothetical protein
VSDIDDGDLVIATLVTDDDFTVTEKNADIAYHKCTGLVEDAYRPDGRIKVIWFCKAPNKEFQVRFHHPTELVVISR